MRENFFIMGLLVILTYFWFRFAGAVLNERHREALNYILICCLSMIMIYILEIYVFNPFLCFNS